MNFATILPRFPHAGARAPQARRPVQAAGTAPIERRTMARHAILRLDNRPLQLRVLRGWVWVTRDGCIADLVLGAGQVFEQRPGAPVLVQALEASEVSIAGAGVAPQNA
jgi:Protein of unknown function (DUF2917)